MRVAYTRDSAVLVGVALFVPVSVGVACNSRGLSKHQHVR
jgi:hypothetical protein